MIYPSQYRLGIAIGLLACLPAHALQLTFAVPNSPPNRLTEMSQALLTEAAHRLGHELRFLPLPQERGLASVDAGTLDGDSLRSTDLDLKSYTRLTRINVVIADDELVAFGVGKVFTPHGLKSIRPFSVASTRIKELEQLGNGYHFTFVATDIQAFEMLRRGRVKLAVFPRSVLCPARKAGYSDLTIQEPALQHLEFVAHLSIRHEKLARQFERTLLDMRRDGSMERIQAPIRRKWANCSAATTPPAFRPVCTDGRDC
ncbi:ABC transporter substrate-binding protein [Paludibacterium yongneupense]|uniref:ABC transporter substrate-binding protein n=1 Tax=Paludibacterium yongneupense TaxID=400061 RepID=UPI00040310A7|nr:ABC transporter substrate-binding protein [Paludibacterium yongneupense]